MNLLQKKIFLAVTLLICGWSIGLIIKNEYEGKQLIFYIIISVSAFLTGIGVWFSKNKKA